MHWRIRKQASTTYRGTADRRTGQRGDQILRPGRGHLVCTRLALMHNHSSEISHCLMHPPSCSSKQMLICGFSRFLTQSRAKSDGFSCAFCVIYVLWLQMLRSYCYNHFIAFIVINQEIKCSEHNSSTRLSTLWYATSLQRRRRSRR